MAEELVLDTAIRDWVLIPLSVVMVLIGILRYFVSKLMRSSQVPDAKIVKEGYAFRSRSCLTARGVCLTITPSSMWLIFVFFSLYRQVIVRARNLRAAANFIPAKSFRARRLYYSNEVWFLFLIISLARLVDFAILIEGCIKIMMLCRLGIDFCTAYNCVELKVVSNS